MIGMRVPAELGKTRAASLRRKLDAMAGQEEDNPGNGFDLSVDTALDLIGGHGPRRSRRTDGADPDWPLCTSKASTTRWSSNSAVTTGFNETTR